MIKKIITSFILSIILVVTVQAAMGIPDTYKPKNIPLQGLNTTITDAVKADSQGGAVTGVNIVLQYMANLLLFFAAPLAVLFLARAGADYAFAMGEDSKLESAKRELTWSIIGLVLVMFSYVLVRVLIQPAVMLQDSSNKILEAQCMEKYGTSCAAQVAKEKEDIKNATADINKGKSDLEAARKEALATQAQADSAAAKAAQEANKAGETPVPKNQADSLIPRDPGL